MPQIADDCTPASKSTPRRVAKMRPHHHQHLKQPPSNSTWFAPAPQTGCPLSPCQSRRAVITPQDSTCTSTPHCLLAVPSLGPQKQHLHQHPKLRAPSSLPTNLAKCARTATSTSKQHMHQNPKPPNCMPPSTLPSISQKPSPVISTQNCMPPRPKQHGGRVILFPGSARPSFSSWFRVVWGWGRAGVGLVCAWLGWFRDGLVMVCGWFRAGLVGLGLV